VQQTGIDFSDPSFWQQGYEFLRDLIEELNGLVCQAAEKLLRGRSALLPLVRKYNVALLRLTPTLACAWHPACAPKRFSAQARPPHEVFQSPERQLLNRPTPFRSR
jgi:hypothetical protein